MKILVITPIFPPDIGGPASYVPAVSASLVEKGHAVTVLTLSDLLTHNDSGYRFPVIRILRSAARVMRMLQTISLIVRQGRAADVLFVNGLALEAAMANLFLRKPLVQKIVGDLAWERAATFSGVTDRLDDFQNKTYGMKIEALKSLRTFWVKKSSVIITPSNYLKKIVSGWGIPEKKITVIYNAVDGEAKKSGVQQADLPQELQDSAMIISAGRLVPWKGFAELISVMEFFPGAHLIIAGEGPEREHLQHVIDEKKITGRVILRGNISRLELLELLNKAALFVLNSTYEGLPHIVLEALQARIPVIATNVGGTSELIQHEYNGLLIPAGDHHALRAALQRLLEDAGLRSRLAENGSASLEKFSWPSLVEQTEAILAAACGCIAALSSRDTAAAKPIPVLFLSSARYANPPDRTTQKKWLGLAPLLHSTILSFGRGRTFQKFVFAGSCCTLLPSDLPRMLRYGLHFLYSFFYTLAGALQGTCSAVIAQSPYEALAPALALLPWKLLRSRTKPRLIVEVHSDWGTGAMLYHHYSPLAWLEKPMRKLLGSISLSQADAYRVISVYCRSLVPDNGKPVFVFPTFTDLESFSEPPAEAVHEAAEKINGPYFIFVGMLIYLKGIHYLIRAFRDVALKHPKARLVIAGQGREEEKLRGLARELNLQQQVIFAGHLEQSVLAAYIKASRALILPSLTEGLGRVAIEAQFLGKPVIASRIGGIPEIVIDGETGLLVEPGDERSLAEAMARLLDDAALAERMGAAGRVAVRDTFSYQDYYRAYHAMVQKVCHE
jgi:glycosyltransferase involved in cell wall biosynthesis